MEHQVWIGPQQAGRVGAQGQGFRHPLGPIGRHGLSGGNVRPAVEHGHGRGLAWQPGG